MDVLKIEFGGSGMTKNCYDWIEANIKHGSKIVEFGAGKVSTKVLSEKWNLFSIEQDKKYVGTYEKANYIYAPIVNDWYDPEKVFSENFPKDIDLLIIDGPLGGDRSVIIKYFHKMNIKDAVVIVDDIYRPENKLICDHLESLGKKIVHIGEDERIENVMQFAVLA